MEHRRVAITGISAITGYGVGAKLLTDALFDGRSCIRRIEKFDASRFSCQIGSEAPEIDGSQYFKNPKDARRMEPNVVQAVAAAKLAVEDSGLEITAELAPRVGVYVGTGIGGLNTLENEIEKASNKGFHRMSPFFIINAIGNVPAGVISIETGAKGPSFCIVSACATSGHCLGEAMLAIRHGRAEVIIAGGTERALNRSGLGGFCSMKAVTGDYNDAPTGGSRPFDAKRSGFVMGEGAGIMILEEWGMAQARDAKIYGELVGYGASADAFHVTAPPEGGPGAQQAMRACLADAGVEPEQIGYINAHGTSTPLNDKYETQAIRAVFGSHADKLLISSTKSMHGHLLGAAAAVEGIACLEAFQRNMVPPTINYENPDPDCDLNYVPNTAVAWDGDYALCNTFGFGGQNAVLLFKRA